MLIGFLKCVDLSFPYMEYYCQGLQHSSLTTRFLLKCSSNEKPSLEKKTICPLKFSSSCLIPEKQHSRVQNISQ